MNASILFQIYAAKLAHFTTRFHAGGKKNSKLPVGFENLQIAIRAAVHVETGFGSAAAGLAATLSLQFVQGTQKIDVP